jgi:hypothetical protein
MRIIEHMMLTRAIHAPPLAHTTLRYPHRSCEATMAPTYRCKCSKCHGAINPKSITKRTVEAHIQQDRQKLQSALLSNTDLIDFLQLRVDKTLQVLSGIHGGLSIPDTVSDFDGSHPAGSEGTIFTVTDIHLF